MPRTTQKTTKYLLNWFSLYGLFPQKEIVSKENFRMILKLYHNLIYREIVAGRIVKFPHGAGLLGLFKRPTGKIIDYGHYQKTGEKRIRINLHSDEYRIAAKWFHVSPVYLRGVMSFKLKRQQARRLAQHIKTEPAVYKYRSLNEKHIN